MFFALNVLFNNTFNVNLFGVIYNYKWYFSPSNDFIIDVSLSYSYGYTFQPNLYGHIKLTKL